MTFKDWLSDTRQNLRKDGITGFKTSLYELYLGTWRRVGRIYNYGKPIYEEDWDLLIVLDACRADLLAEVAHEYDFLDGGTEYSVASTSEEWLEKCFLPNEYQEMVRKTTYVSGNPFTDSVFFEHQCPDCGNKRERDPDIACPECGSDTEPERIPIHNFAALKELWRNGWDDEMGTIPARVVTDHTIVACREGPSDRVVAHYMQPHHPFVGSEIETSLHPSGFGERGRESVWDQLREGKVGREQVWEDYRENLRYVLNDVERLLRNVDADRVVITADHGNAVGEFGLYGHYRDVPIPSMKQVPWCVTTAVNSEEEIPDASSTGGADADVKRRLEDLGYM